MLLASNVTSPVCQSVAAIDIGARIQRDALHGEDVPGERCAGTERRWMPTLKNTLPPCAPLISLMPEALAVVSDCG